MDIIIEDDLQALLRKLAQCEDPKTHQQLFIGSVRVWIKDETIRLQVEDPSWSTEGGQLIPTEFIK